MDYAKNGDQDKKYTIQELFSTIHLRSIEILALSFHLPERLDTNMKSFDYVVKIEDKADFNKNLLFVVVKINVKAENSEESLAHLAVSVVFMLDDFKTFVHKTTSDELEIPSALQKRLHTLAIDTSRGVMFGAFRGTFLHQALLPVLDAETLKPLNA